MCFLISCHEHRIKCRKQQNKLLFIMEVDVIINQDTSDFAQTDTVMSNDKAVNCLTGTVKMTKSKLSE